MKKVILFLALLTCPLLAVAQKGISYQAVILDPKPIEIPGQDITGQPFVNGAVSLKFKIFSTTFVQEFEEVHAAKTDAYGLVNVLIGSVSPGAFSSLVWDSNPKNMQVWVSFDNGGTYTKVSEQVLTYNPYAIYAETAGKLGGTLGIAGGGTGATTAAAARTNLGLGNVDNTADANKPISTATQAALDTKANANEVSTALATKASAAEVATALGTKANASDVTTSLGLKEDVSNKANTPLGSSTTLFPTQNAVKTYVDAQVAGATIADASSSTKGKIQLAGDLSGTAAAPTVPGLALKANASEVTAALAVKADTAYVLTKVAAATIADASSSTKGKIQLAGDLAGTAAAPTVPGLALKANTAEVNTSLALKAPIASPTFTGTVSGITKSMVGLGSVDNTTDAAKPISTATQAALDLKATAADLTLLATTVNTNTADITTTATDLATLTTVVNSNTASITANTSDILLKANTTDVTTALALKADLESPALSGVPTAPTASAGTNTTQVATTAFVQSSVISNTLSLGDVNVLPTAQGATIVSNVLKLSPANETNSGLVNTSNQTFAGVKTFNDGAKKQITATTANVDQSLITTSDPQLGSAFPQWQSFTAGITGILSSVEWQISNFNQVAENVTLNLYEGEGVNGTLLATSSQLVPVSTNPSGYINFPLTNVVVQAGSKYTMKVTTPSSQIRLGIQTVGSYSGGKTGLTLSLANADFLFKTNVKAITSESFITASDVEIPLALKADLESPTFTGTPNLPTGTTGVTQATGDNSTKLATTAFVASAVNTLSGNSGVPYTGATGAVDLGSYDLKVNGLTIGRGNGDGFSNTAIGTFSLKENTDGDNNTAIGYSALLFNNLGEYNTALGAEAGVILKYPTTMPPFNTASNKSVYLGAKTKASANGAENEIVIGFDAYGKGSNTITLGNDFITQLYSAAPSITSLSDRRDKTEITSISEGIDFVKKLNPVTFTWNTRDKAKVGIKSAGFIAQELLALQKGSTIGDNLDLVSEDDPEKLEARYTNLLPVMVKAIQEQQVLIEAQKKQIDELKLILEKLLNEKK